MGKVIGYQVWRLGLVEVVISYALAMAVFALLPRRLRLRRWTAVALSLLFVLSATCTGPRSRSHRQPGDAVRRARERLERYLETDRLGPFAAACASICAAMLTRQSTAFMLAAAGLYALHPRLHTRARAVALGVVVLSAVPFTALVLSWHGLVPPGSDPARVVSVQPDVLVCRPPRARCT